LPGTGLEIAFNNTRWKNGDMPYKIIFAAGAFFGTLATIELCTILGLL
jgi:hypothetical protein